MMADIFNHLWQSTIFAAVVALLCFACRRNRARLRYGLWFVASAKFLVPFAALTAAGGVLEWQQAPASVASVMTSPIIRELNEPFAEISLDASALAVTSPDVDWIVPSIFALWVCGFAAIAIKRVNGWRRIRAAIRVSAPWDATTTRLRQGYGGQAVPAGIEIRNAPTVLEPGVVGLWKPVILLPAGIDTYLTERQLAAVIAHEVCHARRRDSLTAAVHMLVEAIFWFHPMVWWIGARLVAEREQACDEHVVAETAEPVAYAEGIVSVCRRYVETPLMSVAGVGGADVKARIDAILANRISLRLTLSKRLVLTAVAVLSLTVPVVTGAIEAAAFAAGQLPGATAGGPPIDPQLRFEVVSIKPFDASGGAQRRMTMNPGRYDVMGMPLRLVVGQGLRAPLDRIVGWPDWIDTAFYTIAAKMPDGPPPPPTAIFVMVENLLKDRFKLVTHRETRELPVYNLVLARPDRRPGPAFKESSEPCLAELTQRFEAVRRGAPLPTTPTECATVQLGQGTVSMRGIQMMPLANFLTQSVGRPVIDRTGLTSFYDLTLKWTPDPGGNPAPFGLPAGVLPQAPQPPADPDAPNIFTAVQEQLGLKLEAGRGPVEVVVIERLEKPTLD
jgi:bla regulator protein blaR1